MNAMTFLAFVSSIAMSVILLSFVVGRSRQSQGLSRLDRIATPLVAVLVVVWLSFASTYLFWIVPVPVLISGWLGYLFGAKLPLSVVALDTLLLAIRAAGVASLCLVLAAGPERAFGYMPHLLFLADYGAFLAVAGVFVRRRRDSQCSRPTFPALNSR